VFHSPAGPPDKREVGSSTLPRPIQSGRIADGLRCGHFVLSRGCCVLDDFLGRRWTISWSCSASGPRPPWLGGRIPLTTSRSTGPGGCLCRRCRRSAPPGTTCRNDFGRATPPLEPKSTAGPAQPPGDRGAPVERGAAGSSSRSAGARRRRGARASRTRRRRPAAGRCGPAWNHPTSRGPPAAKVRLARAAESPGSRRARARAAAGRRAARGTRSRRARAPAPGWASPNEFTVSGASRPAARPQPARGAATGVVSTPSHRLDCITASTPPIRGSAE
jgi:hypothetical protein